MRSKLAVLSGVAFRMFFRAPLDTVALIAVERFGLDIIISIVVQYWHLAFVGTVPLCLSISFVRRFELPGRLLSKELEVSISSLKGIKGRTNSNAVELDEIATKAMPGTTLSHLWSEYTGTLHPQRAEDEHGQSRIIRWRATTLAETYFTEQAIVDTRLNTEFFKHLPGILRDLGIIGTFIGLILGLIQFDVSLKPDEAQAQLRKLVNSVGDAFVVSAPTIILAMWFTGIEKSRVALCYRQAEKIRELIDSLFKMGAGEEYLKRLVLTSETSAT